MENVEFKELCLELIIRQEELGHPEQKDCLANKRG